LKYLTGNCLNAKKRNNEELVIMRDNKIIRVKPEDMLSELWLSEILYRQTWFPTYSDIYIKCKHIVAVW
jgi:hypothetical protein